MYWSLMSLHASFQILLRLSVSSSHLGKNPLKSLVRMRLYHNSGNLAIGIIHGFFEYIVQKIGGWKEVFFFLRPASLVAGHGSGSGP
jgi:hypothetical protein